MEIIGKVNDCEYIVKVKSKELCDLLDKNYRDWFDIGTKIDIAAIYKVVDSLRRNKTELKRQAEQLRAVALLLEPMQDIINLTLEGEVNE